MSDPQLKAALLANFASVLRAAAPLQAGYPAMVLMILIYFLRGVASKVKKQENYKKELTSRDSVHTSILTKDSVILNVSAMIQIVRIRLWQLLYSTRPPDLSEAL